MPILRSTTRPLIFAEPKCFHRCSRSFVRPQRFSADVRVADSRRGHGVVSESDQDVHAKDMNGAAETRDDQDSIELRIEVISNINKVSAEEWNACAKGASDYNPFVSWEFLDALEASDSAVQTKGWLAQHVLVSSEDGTLLGCCPLYLKGHSYGEYVFDHQWAEVCHYMGKRYYPKLQSCVPFTPVTGSRMLTRPGPYADRVVGVLAQGLKAIADSMDVSSLHMTFNTDSEYEALESEGFIGRMGMQYHWQNKGYETFNDFLLDLKQSRRKTIKQERKCLQKHGLSVRRLRGSDIKASDWDDFYTFYLDTCNRKWGEDYLTREFFHMMGENLGDDVLLFVAEDSGGDSVAAALNLIASDKLFGRVWGKRRGVDFRHLHFELSYYQALDVAIENKISTVEAGAQGQHKIQRGYLPSPTYSSHYVREPKLRTLVAQALKREKLQNAAAMEHLTADSPFKNP
ncbi:hypothetical protein BSKO_00657 [Bryopsis sp. KO-2023]|nr:hypothetical protein BSKO_00657 [Bryopsis sp. KO-2023]